MGLFKKPNRKFRQRVTHTDSEDESASTEATEKKPNKPESEKIPCFPNSTEVKACASTSGAVPRDEKPEVAQPKPSKLLSFHDEDDETEVFKLKKSNYSRRLAKQREREKKKREEALASEELREAQINKAEGSHKAKDTKDASAIYAGHEAEDMEVESEEEKEKLNPFREVLQSGVIPDAATIYAMKKHRQMAREMGDFIPIEDPEKEDESKSRLIREDEHDDDDDDDDDEPSRINFTVNTAASDRQKMRETFLSLQESDRGELENEDAAELELWEREQIRKGVSVTQVGSNQSATISEDQLYSYSSSTGNLTCFPGVQRSANSNVPDPSLMPDLFKNSESNLTTGDIKARLEQRLSALRESHKVHEQEIRSCQKELVETTELMKKLETDAPLFAQSYSLYQQMRGYVRDLVECLDLKVAHVELLDSQMLDLCKARSQKLIARRQQDIRDQADEYSTVSSEILKGVSVEFLSEKTISADEAKLRRAAEREGRRMRRRKARDTSLKMLKHFDGMSSDDEEPDADILHFKHTKDDILTEAKTVFIDVVEEFGSLNGVMTNFENWKQERPESYSEAFVPLCLPRIFGGFVRLELLAWNPLEERQDFEQMKWYRQLIHYGCNDLQSKTDIKDDPDLNLLPGVMEKIVLPKITNFIQHVWDPLSRKETLNLVHLIRQFSETYPTINGKSKQLQACLKAIIVQIYKALDDDIFIPLYPKELLESRSLGASDFFQRQFWSAVKLLQNILSWDGIIAEQPLQDLALGSLLNRYILMGLHTSITMRDTLEKCKVIVASFPKIWFKNAKGNNTVPMLKQFCTYLLKFADSYSTLSVKRGISDDETKDVIKDIVQLLVTIESLDDAVALAKKYCVSVFKN